MCSGRRAKELSMRLSSARHAPARSSPARPARALFAFVIVFANVANTGVSGAAPQAKSALAPLDAYFGKLHLSAIEIRHRIDALGARYHSRTITDDDLIHDAKLLESAMDVWQRQYPRDSWIVATIYHLEQLYQAVQSDEARAHATALLHFLIGTYPNTPQAHSSRLRLAQGFPPLHSESATHATPNPYGASTVPAAEASTPASPATPNPSGGSAMPAAGGAPATHVPAPAPSAS